MKRSKKKKKGYFNHRRVKAITFYIIISCIILCIVISILRVWQVMDPAVFWRLLISFAILGTGSGLFTAVNGLFRKKK